MDYIYFLWTDVNGQGRLSRITSGSIGSLTSLQDLRYTYDANGNVLTIKDYKAGNPQTQTFTYDALDRLASAAATGGTSGNGDYTLQNYTYSSSTGNLLSKAGISYTYGDSSHKHAVTATGADTYSYDANGNQVTRNVGGNSYTLSYDAENHLVGVSGTVTATFVYDGDGKRVKGTVSGTTTAYLGEYFEWTGSTGTMRRYYFTGNTRVAMRSGSTLKFLLGDHPSLSLGTGLGSTSITTNSSGVFVAEQKYYPWGTVRYWSGSFPTHPSCLGTGYQFTDQRVESNLGWYFYNSRWYDPAAGRFMQADTIVPGGVQGLDRYAYVFNNPLRYIDPSGHGRESTDCGPDGDFCYKNRGKTEPWYKDSDLVVLDEWGYKMLDLLIELHYEKGWWNDNGKSSFDVEDFLILILAYEFQPYIYGVLMPGASRGQPGTPTFEDDLSHASTHSFYAQCASQSTGQVCNGMTQNAILNYVGDLGSGRGRYDAMQNGTLLAHLGQDQAYMTLASTVVNSIQNAPTEHPEWTRTGLDYSNWVSGNEPWSWGNGSMLAISLDDITTDMYLWTLPGESPEKDAYIFTVDQCKLVGCGTNTQP